MRRILKKARPEDRANIYLDLRRLAAVGVRTQSDLFAFMTFQREIDLLEIACWVCGRLGRRYETRSSAVLKDFLMHPTARVRAEAARAFGIICIGVRLDILIDLTTDSSIDVRKAAAYALGRSGDERAVPGLINLIKDSNEILDVRGIAAEALGELQARPALPVLLDLLKNPLAELRFCAVSALGELGLVEALPSLQAVANSDNGVASSLGRVADEAKKAIDNIERRAYRTIS